jgi:hypothetical protein
VDRPRGSGGQAGYGNKALSEITDIVSLIRKISQDGPRWAKMGQDMKEQDAEQNCCVVQALMCIRACRCTYIALLSWRMLMYRTISMCMNKQHISHDTFGTRMY